MHQISSRCQSSVQTLLPADSHCSSCLPVTTLWHESLQRSKRVFRGTFRRDYDFCRGGIYRQRVHSSFCSDGGARLRLPDKFESGTQRRCEFWVSRDGEGSLLVFAGWGIAIGGGLVNIRPWARISTLIFVIWMASQFVASVGLLKLKNWGRVATIGLQLLGIVNGLLLIGNPVNRARFQQIMDLIIASMKSRMPQPSSLFLPFGCGSRYHYPVSS